MEFESTLGKRKNEMLSRHKQRHDLGLTTKGEARAKKINGLIRSISNFDTITEHIIKTVRTIQPSINEEDLRTATCFILTNCSEVVDGLISEKIVKIV